MMVTLSHLRMGLRLVRGDLVSWTWIEKMRATMAWGMDKATCASLHRPMMLVDDAIPIETQNLHYGTRQPRQLVHSLIKAVYMN
jgi:hypothetical protein